MNVCSYLGMILCGCFPIYRHLQKLIDKGDEKKSQLLDVLEICKLQQEFKNLKKILLKKNERVLFKYLAKPLLITNFRDNDDRNDDINLQDNAKISHEFINRKYYNEENLKNLFVSYKELNIRKILLRFQKI